MKAQVHKGSGEFTPQQGTPGLVGGHYEIELHRPIGEFSIGDALIFDTEKEPCIGDLVALRREGSPGVEIGTLLTDLPTGRWELLRTYGDIEEDEDGPFMFRSMTSDIVRSLHMSEFIGIDTFVDGRVWPKTEIANENTPAPKRTKPTPPRGPDGRFLKTDHAEAAPEPAQTAKPWEEVHQGSALPTEPETVPYAQYSRCWQQLDKLSQIAFKMKMAWGLLGPKIADELGRSTGPLNGLLKDGGDGLYVMATADVEIIEYHLVELGNLIEEMHAADAA